MRAAGSSHKQSMLKARGRLEHRRGALETRLRLYLVSRIRRTRASVSLTLMLKYRHGCFVVPFMLVRVEFLRFRLLIIIDYGTYTFLDLAWGSV